MKTTMNNEQFEYMLSKIEDGQSVEEICKELSLNPKYFYNFLKGEDICTDNREELKGKNWIRGTEEEKEETIEERKHSYARAKGVREQWYLKKIRAIAEDDSNDGAKGNKGQNSVKRAQLRIDALKWELGRMSLPKLFEPEETQSKEENESKVVINLKLKKDE